MSNFKLLVVEDSPLMARIVKGIVQVHFPEIEILETADSVMSAVERIKQEEPHIVIMDIQLNEGTAFDVLEQFDEIKFSVIFMSAFHEYLLEALRFSAVEFVCKPFDASDMAIAIDKAIEVHLKKENLAGNHNKLQTLLANVNPYSDGYKLVLTNAHSHIIVSIRDILYIKADLSKSLFTFDTLEPYESNLPLRRYEAMLKQQPFFRCHPYFLINLRQIKYVDPLSLNVYFKNDQSVLLEERKYDQLMKQINRFS